MQGNNLTGATGASMHRLRTVEEKLAPLSVLCRAAAYTSLGSL